MVKLIAPNGAMVDVSYEKALRLIDMDYTEKKAPAKKAASSKSKDTE